MPVFELVVLHGQQRRLECGQRQHGIGQDGAADVQQHATAKVAYHCGSVRCEGGYQYCHSRQGKQHYQQVLQRAAGQGGDAGHIDHQENQRRHLVKTQVDAPHLDYAVPGDNRMQQQGDQAQGKHAATDLPAPLGHMHQLQTCGGQIQQCGERGEKSVRHQFGGWAQVTYTALLCTDLSCHNQ